MRSSGVDARDPYSARRRRRAAARQEVWQTVRDLAASGTTVLLTTQYLPDAEQLADRIAILHQRDRSGYRRYGAPAVVPLVQNLAAGDALLLRAEVVAYLDR